MMENKPLEKLQFVEEFGIYFEAQQMPRMAGRILGWLLVCTPPQQSADELMDTLQASRGTISTMTRMLLQLGFIEKISQPGERRDYFRLRPHVWQVLMAARMVEITRLRQMAERGLGLMGEGATVQERERLEEMRILYQFFETEMPHLLQRYEEEIKNAGQTPRMKEDIP